MEYKDNKITFDCWGKLACFTVPYFRCERFSYDVITPSAVCGLIKNVYWHPCFEYEVVSINVMNPIKRITITTNELSNPCNSAQILNAMTATAYGRSVKDISVQRNETRQQRCTTFLKDVYYRITVRIIPSETFTDEEFNLDKIREILLRRLEKGQSFRTPYFGIRECRAYIAKARPDWHEESPYIGQIIKLGTMLYDVKYHHADDKKTVIDVTPYFYTPTMVDGEINVPTRKEVMIDDN